MSQILLFKLVIFSVTLSLFQAIVFEGPCPAVESQDPLVFDVTAAHVIFSTKIQSRTTHLFSTAAKNFDHLVITLIKAGQQWQIMKNYNSKSQCSSYDVLVPTALNDTKCFKHGIWLRSFTTGLVNQTCTNFWDHYILLQRGEIFVIWGCVSLSNFTKHEESVWVLLLQRNMTYRQNKAQVEKDAWGMFPVGGISKEHLDRTSLKPPYRDIQVQLHCKKLLCSEDSYGPNWQLLVNIIFLGIILVCACISVYMRCSPHLFFN